MNMLLYNIQAIINNQSIEEQEIILRLKTLILEFEETNHVAKNSKSLVDLYEESISVLEENKTGKVLIKSGFNNLDELIGGFSPGEMIVIGGRPGMGKTQLCINLAANISKTIPILYFTFDLSEQLFTGRFISALTSISVDKIIQQNLSDDERQQIYSLREKIQNHQILVNVSCNNSVSALKAHCLEKIKENGVKVIIIDYLQMMTSNRYRHSREMEISHISRELKSFAKDNEVCVIISSQLSRAPEKRSASALPILSDLRESGAIEQDADKVIFLYRPEYYRIDVNEMGESMAGLIELIVAKNRSGRLGSAMLRRNIVFSSFSDFDHPTNEFSFSKERVDEIKETPF